jgi:hypothetical protein
VAANAKVATRVTPITARQFHLSKNRPMDAVYDSILKPAKDDQESPS